MQKPPLVGEYLSGRTSRRQFLKGLASAGITATLIPGFVRKAHAEPDLTVFTWAEYDDPRFHRGFVDIHGKSPHFSFFGDEEEALQQLRVGFTPDVAHPCTSTVRRWKNAGVLKPIDTARIDEWHNIFPIFRETGGTVIDGETYHVPWDWGNDSILYRSDIVDIEEESYAILLDERYRRRMSVLDSAESMTVFAGLIAGVADPFNMTGEEIQRTTETMERIHANLRFYWTDTPQIEQALASGEIFAASAWNESFVNLRAMGLDVKYMAPKEGIMTWVCGLALVDGGPGTEDEAYDYINAMLSPETGRTLIEEFGYGHANQRSLELVPPERLAELGMSEAREILADANIFDEMPLAQRERMSRIFERIKAGL